MLNITTSMKISIVCFIILSFLANPSLGFSATFSNDAGSTAVNCNLDNQASLSAHSVLGERSNHGTLQVSGSGKNEYSYQASANGASAQSKVVSSGQLDASTSTTASDEGVSLSQVVGGSGDTLAYAKGDSGQASTEQGNAALNGNLVSTMGVYSGIGASQSVQNSQISGDVGYVLGSSTAPGNSMFVSGSFAGSGNINADLTSIASDNAEVRGSALGGGSVGIDDGALQSIASNEGLGVSVNALYTTPKNGFGEYQLQAANIKASGQKAAPEPSYKIYAWLPTNPKVHMQLLTNTIPSYLTTGETGAAVGTAVGTAISYGANAWDGRTNQQLFRGDDNINTPGDGNAVGLVSDSTVTYGSSSNGRWTEGWTDKLPIISGGTIIAETRSWTDGSVRFINGKRYPKIVESDCWYNSLLPWTLASGPSATQTGIFDVRTIATHELGHTIGLDDLYSSSNQNQIMYGYNNGQVKWALGAGDLAGLKALYGS